MAGPAGGPTAGGTALTVRGTALQAVTHCQFGNASASAVLSATAEQVVCPSTAVDSLTGLDGAVFEEHAQLGGGGTGDASGGGGGYEEQRRRRRLLHNDNHYPPRGAVPLLLSKTRI